MLRIFLAVLTLSFFLKINAQEANVPTTDTTSVVKKEEPKPEKAKPSGKKMFFGLGLGLGISQSGGNLNVSPMIGYNLHKRIQVGAKFTYWYTWYRIEDPLQKVHKIDDNMFALSAFTRIIIFKGLYFHAEPEYMNRNSYTRTFSASNGYGYTSDRVDVFNMYVGPGFYKGINHNSGVFVQLLWNLNQSSNSYYSNPLLQIGFAF